MLEDGKDDEMLYCIDVYLLHGPYARDGKDPLITGQVCHLVSVIPRLL